MRYTYSAFLLLLTMTIACAPALAQQDSTLPTPGVRIGLGTGLFFQTGGEALIADELQTQSSIDFVPITAISFYVPIAFSGFKLEPELGMYNYSYSITSGSAENQNVSSTSFRIGTGIFYTHRTSAAFELYAGPRVGIVTHSQDIKNFDSLSTPQNSETNSSRTDFYVGLSVGGEYFFSEHFSLGVEAELEYLNLGKETTTVTPAAQFSNQQPTSTTGDNLVTKAGIVARVYF